MNFTSPFSTNAWAPNSSPSTNSSIIYSSVLEVSRTILRASSKSSVESTRMIPRLPEESTALNISGSCSSAAMAYMSSSKRSLRNRAVRTPYCSYFSFMRILFEETFAAAKLSPGSPSSSQTFPIVITATSVPAVTIPSICSRFATSRIRS